MNGTIGMASRPPGAGVEQWRNSALPAFHPGSNPGGVPSSGHGIAQELLPNIAVAETLAAKAGE